MSSTDKPTPQDWERLAKIVRNIDLIVDDAPEPPPAAMHGILAPPRSQPAAFDSQGRRLSKLGVYGGSLLTGNLRDELEAVLPGVSDLGTNRDERLANMRTRAMGMRAWAWISRQTGFQDAKRTAEYLAARKNAAYSGQANDFRLVDAIAFPLLFAQLPGAFTFPVRTEVERAKDRAVELLQFLNASSGLIRQGRIAYHSQASLEQLAADLGALIRAGYKKPKDTDPVPEVQFAFDVCDGLHRVFGEVSKSILGSVLTLVDYSPDDARLRWLISEADARRGSN